MTQLLDEKIVRKMMYAAVDNDTAQILTVEKARELKGKRIITLYFGYNSQDGTDDFIVGDIVTCASLMNRPAKSDYENFEILKSDGNPTCIRAHKENEGKFTCSDSDRFVFFLEVVEEKYLQIGHYAIIHLPGIGIRHLVFDCCGKQLILTM